ncbi:porin family protein [Ciceribacter sp. L1K23]|uniref:outer membrane protein n=1 Tax=unclassified Ciceribacter TaxID=2628820 RepID=UPI001ABEDDE6|nr:MULTISPECIES: outer membrane protein [unclassified Ciceribacter]MBO3759721.1 porin family protein [Ciceribacter sp. L1K22]MBR0556123.1 porin family protein [Ciceribacter sp. L1K23]
MRKFMLTLMASAAGVMAFTSAQAADAVEQIPEAPAATETYTAPPQGWTGAYIGGGVTYDWGRMGGGDRDIDGIGGTVYGGYNWQSGPIVYGAEADVSYNGADGDAGAGLTGENGVNGSIRGRIGYDMNPFLIYGTGGLAVGNHELSDGTNSDDKTALGYTVGAGVEALVTDNITARVEYRYTDYQSKDFDLGGTTYSRGFDDHSVKVGIGMKF